MKNVNQNRDTWIGYRPSVIVAKKGNRKQDRKVNKQICRDLKKGGEW